MKKVLMLIHLLMFGGGLWLLIELLWRGWTHPAMYIVGGLCFVLIGRANNWFTYKMSLLLQAAIATVLVLLVEFTSGCICNLWLGLGIWDYSALPFNLLGQIQLYFAGVWYVLAIHVIIMSDYQGYWLFGEEKPHYKVF